MKFFIFTCLVAVALAKHNLDQQSSSEENICSTSCEETTKNTPEMESACVSASQECVQAVTQNKNVQVAQKMTFFQCLQAIQQSQVAMNLWSQIQTCAQFMVTTPNREELSTSEEFASFSQEQYKQKEDKAENIEQAIPKKTINMDSTEIVTESTEMTEEQKNIIKFLNKIKQFIWLQNPVAVHEYQKILKAWNQGLINPNPVVFPLV